MGVIGAGRRALGTICGVVTLAEALTSSSPFQRQSHEKRRASLRVILKLRFSWVVVSHGEHDRCFQKKSCPVYQTHACRVSLESSSKPFHDKRARQTGRFFGLLVGSATRPEIHAQGRFHILWLHTIHRYAHAERREVHPSTTRPLSSRNYVFLLDFAPIFVYLTATVQAIMLRAMVRAFL